MIWCSGCHMFSSISLVFSEGKVEPTKWDKLSNLDDLSTLAYKSSSNVKWRSISASGGRWRRGIGSRSEGLAVALGKITVYIFAASVNSFLYIHLKF